MGSTDISSETILYKINDIKRTINELKSIVKKDYRDLSLVEKHAIRYNIIVLVEAIVSLCILIARKMYEYTPKSYADAVRFVCEKIGVDCVDELIALVRLRNLLVHRYWEVNDRVIYDSIKRDFSVVEQLIKLVEEKVL